MADKQMINDFVRIICTVISEKTNIENYNQEMLQAGMKSFIQDNGFDLALEKFDKGIVQDFIRRRAREIADSCGDQTGLYFENYDLIESFRITANNIHRMVLDALDGKIVSKEQVSLLKSDFDAYFSKITAVRGLRDFLSLQISEAIADIDMLEGKTTGVSMRTRDK